VRPIKVVVRWHFTRFLYMPDDLEGSVAARGFGERFHEGIVPFMVVDNPGNI